MDAGSLLLGFGVILIGGSVSFFAYIASQALSQRYVDYEAHYIEAVEKQKEGALLASISPKLIVRLGVAMAGTMFLISILLSIILRVVPVAAVLFVLASTAAGFVSPRFMIKMVERKRIEKFNRQLIDGLMMVSNCLKSGFSLPQALELLVNETQAPLSVEFSLVLKEFRLGRTMEQALSNLLKRVPCDDLEIAVTSILVVREVGGNLAAIFDTISETIRERYMIQSRIKALTSQGKLQGIVVGSMPIILGVAINFVQPELMKLMFETSLGIFLLLIIFVLEAIGALLIKRIVTIDI